MKLQSIRFKYINIPLQLVSPSHSLLGHAIYHLCLINLACFLRVLFFCRVLATLLTPVPFSLPPFTVAASCTEVVIRPRNESSLASPCLARNFHKSVEKENFNFNTWRRWCGWWWKSKPEPGSCFLSSQRMPQPTRLLIFIEFILWHRCQHSKFDGLPLQSPAPALPFLLRLHIKTVN